MSGVRLPRISVPDPLLAQRITDALTLALSVDPGEPAPVVRLRSRAGLARRAERLRDALVIVQISARNRRVLAAMVDACRTAGCRAVQLVWDGASPSPRSVERRVFSLLEQARNTPALPPVFLAPSSQPLQHLLPPRPRPSEALHAHV